MADHPGYRLLLVGHSMGAGTAAILTMMCAAAPNAALDESLPTLVAASLVPCRS
jgi:pimeloyl-ACP methyl ester carboxylesterase